MKKLLCHLLVLSFLFIYGSLSAQTDSAYFDLGRTKLRKDFTQHITIKGSDLEHMPFARITDALSPWLHGTLSTRPNVVFVVDGNLVNDVDAWSIYDIEEVTLIQNALTQSNATWNNQQLVLVTTKRKQSSSKGITIAGSTYLTDVDYLNAGIKTENNLYHQYHIGAWKDLGKVSIGASANWQRDVFPMAKDFFQVHTPRQMNRFRFNGWMDATLAEGHTLTLRLNVVPQTISSDISNKGSTLYMENNDFKGKSTTINPSLHLSNRFAKNFRHELDFSYFTNRAPADMFTTTTYLPPASGNFQSRTETTTKFRNILVRDRISYTHSMGQWQLQPAVSLSYRAMKQETDARYTTWNNGSINTVQFGESSFKAEAWLLTPAISLSYGNAFNITGGVVAKLKEDASFLEDRIYPFITTTLDVLRIARPANPNSLKVFGSFAMPGDFMDIRYQQPDLQFDPYPAYANFQGPIYGGNVIYMPYPQNPTYHSFQAGAVFSLPDDKLQISYNFDNRRYLGELLVSLAGGTGYDYAVYHPDYIYTTHRLAILSRVITKGELRWLSGINFTGLKYKIKDEDDYPSWRETNDANNGKMLWTGGFTNRLQYRNFTFGLDILYQLNDHRYRGPIIGYDPVNSFRLNNIYAGYSFKIAKGKPLEVYLSARNPWQSEESDFFDNRRYYGAGFKLGF